jgi:hypothetical protein
MCFSASNPPPTYAYLLARYGRSSAVLTFDFVTIQFYESYSDLHHTIFNGTFPASALIDSIKRYLAPWSVNFSGSGVEWDETKEITIDRVVIGIANGWAKGSDRVVFIENAELEKAWDALKYVKGFLGFGFWTIGEEGKNDVWLVKDLNELKTL